jgi:TolC family type I secretion outer membrane protein
MRRAGRIAAVAFLAALTSGCLGRQDGSSLPGTEAQGDAASVVGASPGPADGKDGVLLAAGLTLPPHLRSEGLATASPAATALTIHQTIDPTPAASLPSGAARRSPAAARGPARTVKLSDAVASAVMTYPEIKAFEARAREARAGIGIARAAMLPTLESRIAVGPNFTGAYEGTTIPYDVARSNNADGRFDGGLVLRQLVFDFGAARSDVERAELSRDAERLKLRDKIDEIAGRTAQTYLRVMEQRALLSLVDEIIAAHEELARIVEAHAREGHGTIADVQRVNSRLVDVRAIRSDVSLQQMAAEDQFERLTRMVPGRLLPTPDLRAHVPRDSHAAIAAMLVANPRLAALQSTARASQKELESQRQGALPRINLEVEGETKNFRNGPAGRMQAEARAMLAMRYRIMDGGLSAATQQQIQARIEGNDFLYLNEREQIEQDIRQAYRAIASAGRKLKLVTDGVQSARKVRELYLEQFKGGKRTVFELLDSQMSFFTIRRSQIESQYEGERAVFEILRATGVLTATLARR